MAEESGQERTEEPTQKRLDDARRKGQIPRSRELNTFVVLMAGILGCGVFGGYMAKGLAQVMTTNFRLPRETLFQPGAVLEHAMAALLDALLLLTPLLAIMVVAAVAAPLLLGGWLFSWESLQPKFSKFNPAEGLKRMFGVRGLMELAKSLLKMLLLGSVAYGILRILEADVLALAGEDLAAAVADGLKDLWWSTLLLGASLAVLAGIDVPYQLWDHRRKLKMTLQEIKDEMKESEGRPEVKSKIRQLQRERSQQRMMEEVPEADVVVTNPTHYAVALRYDQTRGGAPRVVAKGVDLIAAQIRNKAVSAGVPLVAAPPLARALYHSTELEREIPEALYLAVAQVLAYVYQLKTARTPHESPAPPSDLPVPEEYLQEN
ncbi:flagellar biosynthesis protein FlhB [Methylohalobius crimeensis]|uniref:flagellar biosynthesis protein FlhB n=1 Tax=Methylohalobius crimeensis TaxID=244365 RepID=UPI0003B384FB|nr:flagellar biosynthesis protein FlhB [Methylohalobius crimeensis]